MQRLYVSPGGWALLISTIVSLWIIRGIWKSSDSRLLKIMYSVTAVIPVIGPLAVLWIRNFPTSQPNALKDQNRYQADVFDRWRDAIDERDVEKKYRLWRDTFEKDPSHRPSIHDTASQAKKTIRQDG